MNRLQMIFQKLVTSKIPLIVLKLALIAVSGQSLATAKATPKDLYSQFRPAVVEIKGTQMGIDNGSLGTGFFVSEDGELITNYHVLRDSIHRAAAGVYFRLSDGTIIKDYEVAQCTDERGIDICLLRLKVKPKSWFKKHTKKPAIGQEVFVIGHPRGFSYTFTQGMVSAVRESDAKILELQVTAALNPGNSGGPIFDNEGNLMGVATYVITESEALNFGITAKEAFRFISSHRKFQSHQSYSKMHYAMNKKRSEELSEKLNMPIINALKKRPDPEKTLKGFQPIWIKSDRWKVTGYLPNQFSCHVDKVEGVKQSKIHCKYGFADFEFYSQEVSPSWQIQSLNGTMISTPEPLELTQRLINNGTWPKIAASLTAKERKYMYSSPSAVKCRTITHPAFNNNTRCYEFKYNSRVFDASSLTMMSQHNNQVFYSRVTTTEASQVPFYFDLLAMFVMTLRRVDTPEPMATKRQFSSIR